MKVRTLFTHFNTTTKVELYDKDYTSVLSWEGKVENLINGSKSTYAYSDVCDWYFKNGILKITIK